MNAREVVSGYTEAYNDKDVSAMLTFFDEGCVFENISGGKITVCTRVKAELEALARQSVEAFVSRNQLMRSITEGQGRLVVEVEFRGVLQADLSTYLKAGSESVLRGVSVFEISGGKITRLSDYS